MFKLSSEGKLLPASKESWLAHDFFPSILNGHKRVKGVLRNAKLRLWICFLFVYDVFEYFVLFTREMVVLSIYIDVKFVGVPGCDFVGWWYTEPLFMIGLWHIDVTVVGPLTELCLFIATNTCLPQVLLLNWFLRKAVVLFLDLMKTYRSL